MNNDGMFRITELPGRRKPGKCHELNKTYIKGQLHSKNKLSFNERVEKMQKNEPSLTSMRQMVPEISHSKVRNLSKIEVAILKVLSLIFTQI